MKHVMLVLVLIAVIVGCGSDKTTDTFVPIDPAWLIGTWDGDYALTYDAGTDSARTYEVEIQIVFADTSFTFSGDQIMNCGTYGAGRYQVKGGVLEFEDHTFRPTICDWANTLVGQFTYRYNISNSPFIEMRMSQSINRYTWHIELVKMPEIIHY